jgi:hypothetical protein
MTKTRNHINNIVPLKMGTSTSQMVLHSQPAFGQDIPQNATFLGLRPSTPSNI